jgi:3-oxoacyl-[acyl-carrier protein] reductase
MMDTTRFLDGQTALVTGASRGVGAATARALAQAGCATVLLHYGSYQEGAEAVARDVESLGVRAELWQADLATPAGIASLCQRAREHGAIDVLVNNAGSLIRRVPLAGSTPEFFDETFNLNVKSLWLLTQAAAEGMAARGRGAVVNLSSIAARTGGGPGATLYAAAKAAVSAITKGLAKELAPAGVRVNAVSPGTVDNDFHARFSTREVLDSVAKATPQGRLSTNEDMAGVILFLCSPAAANVHGQTIEVNGGFFMV